MSIYILEIFPVLFYLITNLGFDWKVVVVFSSCYLIESLRCSFTDDWLRTYRLNSNGMFLLLLYICKSLLVLDSRKWWLFTNDFVKTSSFDVLLPFTCVSLCHSKFFINTSLYQNFTRIRICFSTVFYYNKYYNLSPSKLFLYISVPSCFYRTYYPKP